MTDTPTSAEALDRLMSLNAQAARDDMIEIDRLRTALDAAEAQKQAAVEAALREAAMWPSQYSVYGADRSDAYARGFCYGAEAFRSQILALIPDTGSALDRMLDEAPPENPTGFTEDLERICAERCAEFGDRPCWRLPELVEPCDPITPCEEFMVDARKEGGE